MSAPGTTPMPPSPARVLAISGSLRAESANTRLLAALPALAPPGMSFDVYPTLGELPLYNQDLDVHPALPAVRRWRTAISRADGLVIATPEYNHSIPGVLKNAVDWASRPRGDASLCGKGIAVMVVTASRLHGFRGLTDTVRILTGLGNLVVPDPEVVVGGAPEALTRDADGSVRPADPLVAARIRIQLQALADVIRTDAASAALAAPTHHRRRP
ncbi:NAD(P)H-dependent oxidoreductase (plasmid) [Embleya sp. NBC_00888]|uniref:NADPH-dependent FMN reductase n=1 Tax=Embleya sp. NBC_00888 TaxID=2975960 RepID=UPI002F912673|nr:NAD(P)H-dependent oxidoreductase [Embleya sp. NBC_00888]